MEQMKAEKVFEIAKKVYEEYPVRNKEKSCPTAKAKQEGKRFERIKRLIDEAEKEKVSE